MEDVPRTYGYVRASTRKQVESPDAQKEIIRRYADFNQLGDVTFFVDAAKSGKVDLDKRDAGREMVVRLKRGDSVIVAKIDRAFRRLADCVVMLERWERLGVRLHICNLMGGAIDLSSPMGRFLIHILAAFAELERAFISERTRDGLAGKKRKHQAVSPYAGYGFKFEKQWDAESKRWVKVKVANPAEREVMQSIVKWKMEGCTWDEIRQHIVYTLKLETKEGKEWDDNRIRRAYRAEIVLQLQEQRPGRQTAGDKE